MDAFDVHRHVIADYADYTKSFVRIADERVRTRVEQELAQGLLWPEPLLQLNPAFEPGRSVDELVAEGVLHEECARIFRAKSHDNELCRSMRLHLPQDQAIELPTCSPSNRRVRNAVCWNSYYRTRFGRMAS